MRTSPPVSPDPSTPPIPPTPTPPLDRMAVSADARVGGGGRGREMKANVSEKLTNIFQEACNSGKRDLL
jgi:hypothetical protein